MHQCSQQAQRHSLYVFFLGWASSVSTDFRVGTPKHNLLGYRVASLSQACMAHRRIWLFFVRLSARLHRGIGSLQHAGRLHVDEDRITHYDHLASSSQLCAARSDMRGAFGVVRKISGFNIRAPKVVKLKSGLLSKTEDERQSRWQEHFCEVFSGKIETCRDSLITEPGLPIAEHTFRVTPQDLLQQFIMMSTGKGLGPDTISSDLLKCGGFPMSLAVSRVTDRLVSSER